MPTQPPSIRRISSCLSMPGDIYTTIVGALTVDDFWVAARQCGLDAEIEAMPMGMHTMIGGTATGMMTNRVE